MLDVDYFKSYNDSFGHRAGDEVLKTIATILRSEVREHDIITLRWRGIRHTLTIDRIRGGDGSRREAPQGDHARIVEHGAPDSEPRGGYDRPFPTRSRWKTLSRRPTKLSIIRRTHGGTRVSVSGIPHLQREARSPSQKFWMRPCSSEAGVFDRLDTTPPYCGNGLARAGWLGSTSLERGAPVPGPSPAWGLR